MVFALAAIVFGVFAGLAVFSRKEQGDLLRRMSLRLYKGLSTSRWFGAYIKNQDGRVLQTLISLHPGETPAQLLLEYYIGKIRIVLLILSAGSFLACGAELSAALSQAAVSEGIVSRSDETQTVRLEAAVEDGGTVVREEIVLEVSAWELPKEEAEALYEQFVKELDTVILGENVSLQEVRENLNLPYEVEGYPFVLTWRSDNTALVNTAGEVYVEDLEEPATVILQAKISYGELEWEHSLELTLQPPLRTEREQLLYDLKKQSETADREGRYEESFALPGEIDGKSVSWKQKRDSSGLSIFGLTLAAAAAVYCMKDRDLQEELVKRRMLIKEEYPLLVSKYALFLGAGMTVRGAFIKICRDYLEKDYDKHYGNVFQKRFNGAEGEKSRKNGERNTEIHPLYEEMLYSCNELLTGVSESRVYEDFGRRTGVQEYTRLCTLLNQNLKKGNTELVRRLKEECEQAVRESVQYRKRRGEEAGTKLLLPMVMLLLMVLVMIMLPAFSGLGI